MTLGGTVIGKKEKEKKKHHQNIDEFYEEMNPFTCILEAIILKMFVELNTRDMNGFSISWLVGNLNTVRGAR